MKFNRSYIISLNLIIVRRKVRLSYEKYELSTSESSNVQEALRHIANTAQADSTSCRQHHKILKFIPTHIFSLPLFFHLIDRLSSEITQNIGVFIVFVRFEVLPINKNTYHTVLTKNASFHLINSRRKNENARLVLLPEKVLRNSICRLNLPRNQPSWLQISSLPHPPTNNILRT